MLSVILRKILYFSAISASSFIVYGCYGGEGNLSTAMHRPADGAKAWCDSGVFASGGLVSGEADARRIMNACILACRQHGFIEDGAETIIDERISVLKPEEGWANTPKICQN